MSGICEELKPCPFCGGEARLIKQIEGRHAIARYSVSCKGCGLVAFYEATEAETIAAWNTRTPEQVVIDEPDTIRNELADGSLIADVLAPVCVDEKERGAFERGRLHERFAQQIFKGAGMRGDAE